MTNVQINQIHCIAGPTASGKSAFALKLAKKLGGEIINADALQVYDVLRVLSARPSSAEMQNIPHHLYGHIDPSERYSTGHWLREVDPLIIDILARDKTPILVGGTGLYYKALTQGLAKIPMPEQAAIQAAQKILDQDGIAALRAQADKLDHLSTAKVLGNDPQRLLRIVGVAMGTPKNLSQWQKNTKPILPKGTWTGQVLLPQRDRLYDKINGRFADMVRTGGLVEAKKMKEMGLPAELPAMKAIGLRELIRYLNAEISLDEAVELAMRETRRFAKRQFTWLRGQMPNWEQVSETDLENM